ncbi:MAG: VCBS repeat-containing protein, partial [candidate division WOR-3 bacterium]
MTYILCLTLLFNGFSLKWTINHPYDVPNGKMLIADTDRDGCYELFFTPYSYPASHKIHIYELQLPDFWRKDSFPCFTSPAVWDVGDYDLDGFFDIILTACVSNPPQVMIISIWESQDSFSYPLQEVWRDTAGPGCLLTGYDLDRDGIPEIINGNESSPGNSFSILESIGNNQYVSVYNDLIYHSSTYACGDFDGDGNREFAATNPGWTDCWVYESSANNTYNRVWGTFLNTPNLFDCFSVADADGDSKMEFVAKGFNPPPPPTYVGAYILETTSNNTYEVLKYFEFPDGHDLYPGGYSDAGDIDGDGVPEIVLESCQNIYIIKAYRDENGYYNDSFYVWQTLPGNATGSSVRVFDLDRNGLNEIIISGNNHTRIYEKTPFVAWFCPVRYDTFWANDTVYPRWKLDETMLLDSLRLYWA